MGQIVIHLVLITEHIECGPVDCSHEQNKRDTISSFVCQGFIFFVKYDINIVDLFEIY